MVAVAGDHEGVALADRDPFGRANLELSDGVPGVAFGDFHDQPVSARVGVPCEPPLDSPLMADGGAPQDWDFTLLPFAALIQRLLEAVGAEAVVEVGADRGDFTAELLDWAARHGARVSAIDPEPAPELLSWLSGVRSST